MSLTEVCWNISSVFIVIVLGGNSGKSFHRSSLNERIEFED